MSDYEYVTELAPNLILIYTPKDEVQSQLVSPVKALICPSPFLLTMARGPGLLHPRWVLRHMESDRHVPGRFVEPIKIAGDRDRTANFD